MTRKEQIKSAYKLCGSKVSFYVRGGHKRTDWFIKHLYQLLQEVKEFRDMTKRGMQNASL